MTCMFKVIHYCLQLFLKTLATSVSKYMNLTLLTFCLPAPGLAWLACLKLELLTDIDILLIVEKGNRDGICHSIHNHAKANNKYLKNYNKDMESSYLEYLDANNLYV